MKTIKEKIQEQLEVLQSYCNDNSFRSHYGGCSYFFNDKGCNCKQTRLHIAVNLLIPLIEKAKIND